MSSPDKDDRSPKYSVRHISHENSLRKVRGHFYGELDEESIIAVIVEVSQEEYIPPDVIRRARISPTIFTANIPYKALDRLENDDAVVAIELPRRLQPYSG
jgi:hypothetical protein